MGAVRAEIIPSSDPNFASARIVIEASPHRIFELLAMPGAHQLFDGSGTVQGAISGPEHLTLGANFSMAMKIKLPYRIKNTVVAFEEDRKISWRHLMKWVWSYDIIDLGNGMSQVTESFDATQIPWLAQRWLNATGAMARNPRWMAKSLVRLKAICEV